MKSGSAGERPLIPPYGGALVNLELISTILYEPPQHPEISQDTVSVYPEANARLIEDYLAARGFVKPAFEKTNSL